jgi:integrase
LAERITDRLVKALEPPSTGNKITWDAETSGFGVRATAAGVKSFVLQYRNLEGRSRRLTIGRYPDWTVAAARAESKQIKRDVAAQGIDPLGKRQAVRQAPTVADLAEHFIAEYLPGLRPRSRKDYADRIKLHVVPAIGSLKVAGVTPGDIRGLKLKLQATPITANRVLAITSKMFSFAVGEGYRPNLDNPVKGIARFIEDRRERFLSQTELARLSGALVEHKPNLHANLVRFLLLTGARSGEAMQARWDEFDFQRRVWVKPSAHTKQKSSHTVPLSAPALELLAALPRTTEWLFPSRQGGHLTSIKTSWGQIRRAADLPWLRLHDLRHQFASVLVSGGATLPMIGALLGHTTPQMTARYAHLFDEPLREATELVGRAISRAEQAAGRRH